MRVLIINLDYVYPPVKGYQVMLCKHIEQISNNCVVDLVSFGSENSHIDDPILKLCNSYQLINLPYLVKIANLIRGFFIKDPFQVSLFHSNSMLIAVEKKLNSAHYDVVICQTSRAIQFLPHWYRGGSLLNMIDPLAIAYDRSLSWRPWYLQWVLRSEIRRLKLYESVQVSRFDYVALISQADIDDYKSCSEFLNFVKIPYGVDMEYYRPNPSIQRTPGMIIITGNMGYAPNIDGVRYFCKEVLPIVSSQVPDVHLWLVGIRPANEIKRLARIGNITVTGFVKDIRPYLHSAMVAICPVRLNVGTQTKVLEALAMGTPLVSTSAGNKGVGGVSGKHLYIADSAIDMANYVVSLLKAGGQTSMSNSARELMEVEFQWSKSAQTLKAVLASIASKKIS
jgi:glycosyltransferase involved in cell wall biosynthesis